ncbi:5058_t:CDS:2 [Ambispora gerdemannii]|uniref:5058_t:CDS:1 n=1 Tax=Ambispora gerdemannii TaxID=144530 RepID=A0A9N9AX70_9GLOM|nr:5058_t:CDS:2 [Ambispora gerdemannii]
MNNSIIAIDLFPENDGKIIMYGAPNKDISYRVAGKLRIILSKPLKVKQVVIKLKGKSEYSDWENQYSAINLLKLESILVEKQLIARGVTDFDYEFNIPGNTPQTYVTSFGLINYKLVAVVQPSSMLARDGHIERSINFGRHYLPCRRDLLPAPPTKVYRGQRKNFLKYELDIPTVVGVNEKGMFVRVRLLPLSIRGQVRKITFDLLQSEKYRIQPTLNDLQEFGIDETQLVGNVQLNDASNTKRKRSHLIKPTSLSISNEGDAWNNPLTYNLPFATVKSPLMRVRHRLRIIISFEDESQKRLDLQFPLIFTTIPDEPIDGNHLDSGLPTYDDVIRNFEVDENENDHPIIPYESVHRSNTSDTVNNNLSSVIQVNDDNIPPLRQQRSQQTLGRLLYRSDSDSSSSPNVSTSSSPVSSFNNSSSTARDKRIPPELNLVPATAHTLRPSNSLNNLAAVAASSSTASSSLIRGSRLFTRAGRASWYLNFDKDDEPIVNPEIHSAPSSPQNTHFITPPTPTVSATTSSPTKIKSNEPSIQSPTTTSSIKSPTSGGGFSGMLRRASLTLKPVLRMKQQKMSATVQLNGGLTDDDDFEDIESM